MTLYVDVDTSHTGFILQHATFLLTWSVEPACFVLERSDVDVPMPRAIFTLFERLIESQPADHTCHTPINIQPIKAQLQLSRSLW